MESCEVLIILLFEKIPAWSLATIDEPKKITENSRNAVDTSGGGGGGCVGLMPFLRCNSQMKAILAKYRTKDNE